MKDRDGGTNSRLRVDIHAKRYYTFGRTIDALVNCGQSPFNPSAFRAATTSIVLYAIAIIVSATSLLVVLSPGSLTISTNFQRDRPCVVPTVPSQVMASTYTVSANDTSAESLWLYSITESMLASATYLPPFQDDLASVCGDGVSSCSYNTSFVGPALDCIDVTNGTDFSSITSPSQPMTWNAKPFGNLTGITILSWDLEKNSLQATNCTSYNATYDVNVNLAENAAATVRVRDVNRNSALQKDDSFLYFFASLGLQQLTGECIVQLGSVGSLDCSQSLGPLFVTTAAGNLTFSDTIPHFASSFMQNTSISLLSGNIEYGIRNDTGIAANNLQSINSTCSSPITVYTYNAQRLFLAYGITLAVTVILIAYGGRLILRNGAERNLSISDLIGIALNADMLRMDKKSRRRTRIQLFATNHGEQNLLSMLTVGSTSTEVPSEELTSRREFIP